MASCADPGLPAPELNPALLDTLQAVSVGSTAALPYTIDQQSLLLAGTFSLHAPDGSVLGTEITAGFCFQPGATAMVADIIGGTDTAGATGETQLRGALVDETTGGGAINYFFRGNVASLGKDTLPPGIPRSLLPSSPPPPRGHRRSPSCSSPLPPDHRRRDALLTTGHLAEVAVVFAQIQRISRKLGFESPEGGLMPTEPLRAAEAARRLGVPTKDLLRLAYERRIRFVMVDGVAHFPEDAVAEYRARAS